MTTARELAQAELLRAERTQAGQRIAALEREFTDLAEAAGAAGTDDEHDPEGATLAFERQHSAALLDAARNSWPRSTWRCSGWKPAGTGYANGAGSPSGRTGWWPGRPR